MPSMKKADLYLTLPFVLGNKYFEPRHSNTAELITTTFLQDPESMLLAPPR